MARMLGIDTATTGCSVALMDGDVCLAERSSSMLRGQSEALMPMLASVMHASGQSLESLDGIAITRGPGAFTGLRIGLSAARALALALSKPCIGVGTFDVLAAQAFQHPELLPESVLLVAIESKRAEIFVCGFGPDGTVVMEPAALLPQDILFALGPVSGLTITGDASEKAAQAMSDGLEIQQLPDVVLPDPKIVARLGLSQLATPDLSPPTPFYLRAPDVSLPNPK